MRIFKGLLAPHHNESGEKILLALEVTPLGGGSRCSLQLNHCPALGLIVRVEVELQPLAVIELLR